MTQATSSSTFSRLQEIIAALFLLLWVYTAVSKGLALETFRGVVSASPLIGGYAGVLALLLPVTELLFAGLLFFPRYRRHGLQASFFLITLFTGYVGYMLLFASHLPCSCGGVISRMSWTEHFFFNLCFTLLAALSLWGDQFITRVNSGRRKAAEKSRHYLSSLNTKT